jgi:hypothetical protein
VRELGEFSDDLENIESSEVSEKAGLEVRGELQFAFNFLRLRLDELALNLMELITNACSLL